MRLNVELGIHLKWWVWFLAVGASPVTWNGKHQGWYIDIDFLCFRLSINNVESM